MKILTRWIVVLAAAIMAATAPATAQTFPKLTGRVVDQANLLLPAQEAELTSKLAALETQTGRQLVVATVASLEGRTIEDYGYRLGREWAIGQTEEDDGVVLLVAPNERKVRIETGYGARVFLTDAMSSVISGGRNAAGLGKPKDSDGSSTSSAIGCILASALARDCACLAVEARALLRAI